MNELIPLHNPNPAVLFEAGGLTEIITRIEAEARAIVADVTTTKGRDTIRANAANVARAKTYLDGIGKDYVAKLKEMPRIVDGERKAMRDRLDALRDEVRQPLTQYEEAEKARIDGHQAAIKRLSEMGDGLDRLITEEIKVRLAEIESFPLGESWEEFAAEAASTHQATVRALQAALVMAEAKDRQRIEEEQARQEREAAERAEREKRIAEEAATQARLAAEAEAKRQAEAEAAKAREQAARLADTEHRATINRQAAEAINHAVENWASDDAMDLAKAIVTLIVRGGVPHVTITY